MLIKVPKDVRVFAQVVDDLPLNVIICDRKKFRITYMNEASRRTLERIEHLLPCPADALIGRSIDIFLDDPARQRASYCQKLCMGLSCGGAILAFSIDEFDASNDLGELI